MIALKECNLLRVISVKYATRQVSLLPSHFPPDPLLSLAISSEIAQRETQLAIQGDGNQSQATIAAHAVVKTITSRIALWQISDLHNMIDEVGHAGLRRK